LNFGYLAPPFGVIWDEIRPLLDSAVERSRDSWSEVLADLLTGRAQLWVTVTDRPIAAMVTRIDGATLEVWLAGGDVLKGSVPFLETAIAASRAQGTTNGRIDGRKGWERVLKPFGWHFDGEYLVKDWA